MTEARGRKASWPDALFVLALVILPICISLAF